MSMNCLNGLVSMHQNNQVHGDVRPAYMGYDKNSDTFMMMENLKTMNLPEKVQTQRFMAKKELYMVPELHSKIANRNKK